MKQKDDLEKKIQSSSERSAAWQDKRKPTAAEKKAYAAGILVNKGPAAPAAAAGNVEYFSKVPSGIGDR